MNSAKCTCNVATMVAVVLSMTAISPVAAFGWPICGKAKRITCIVDGDTFWHDKTKYRIVGLNAPELPPRSRCSREAELAQKATLLLQKLMRSGPITVELYGLDHYGRTLALVEVNGKNIVRAMVRSGVARPYSGKSKKTDWCPLS